MSEIDNLEVQPVLKCPHCDEYIIIEKINCAIFRHGVLKANGQQIDPHSPKELCEYYVKNNLIYGCGNPFKISRSNNFFSIEICNYI